MAKYRKKPVVIEAVQLKPINWEAICRLADLSPDNRVIRGFHSAEGFTAEICTLEGIMTAKEGDYIIKGVKGEFYPCKPDIFEMTYEPVEPQQG